MVALNENFAPSKTRTQSKKRVGNFFSGTPDCVGSDRPATRNRIGEKRSCSYDIASGVTYYGFRYYDPETGRWPSRDPYGELGKQAKSHTEPSIAIEMIATRLNYLQISFVNEVSSIIMNGFSSTEEAAQASEDLTSILLETQFLKFLLAYKNRVFDSEFLPEGPNLYAFVGNSPVNGVDPYGLWNLWNPLTWGLPTQPGENPWNPTDSSAEWGATAEGATQGAAAYADGFIPFADPFQDAGVYDPCVDSGTEISQFLGQVGQSAALIATGAGIGSAVTGSAGIQFSSLSLSQQSLIANNIGSAVLTSGGSTLGGLAGAGLSATQTSSTIFTAVDAYNLVTE